MKECGTVLVRYFTDDFVLNRNAKIILLRSDFNQYPMVFAGILHEVGRDIVHCAFNVRRIDGNTNVCPVQFKVKPKAVS